MPAISAPAAWRANSSRTRPTSRRGSRRSSTRTAPFELSILKHQPSGRCLREFFAYEGCDEGTGYFISTYQGDGDPLPTFAGEPVEVVLPEPDAIWRALDPDNKVSLYANVAGSVTLYNKNLGD